MIRVTLLHKLQHNLNLFTEIMLSVTYETNLLKLFWIDVSYFCLFSKFYVKSISLSNLKKFLNQFEMLQKTIFKEKQISNPQIIILR